MILLKGLELKAFNPLLLRLLLHRRPNLRLWHSKPGTHLQMQHHLLLAMCWAKPLVTQQYKALRAQLLQQGLEQDLGQRLDRLV